MKADRDDAPTYARQSARRSNRTNWVVASFLGSAVTVGLLYTLSSLYMQGKVDRLANNPKPKPAPIAEITRSAPAEKDWDKIVEDVARQDAMSYQGEQGQRVEGLPKQTAFNDLNYKPRGADNVVRLQESYQPVKYEKPANKLRVTVIKETKDSTCWPLKEGSIERRNCKAHIGLEHRKK